jgi:hypothetical protein
VRAGEFSATAAAIEAGFRKKPTPFEIISRLLPKLTDSEHDALLRRLLNERRVPCHPGQQFRAGRRCAIGAQAEPARPSEVVALKLPLNLPS